MRNKTHKYKYNMNNIFEENTVGRTDTQAEAALPFNANVTGIRPISMASVAMCQIIDNKIVDTILNNGEIDFGNVTEIMEFIWLHAAPEEVVAACVVRYGSNPELLREEVLMWGMHITPDDMLAFIKDIVKDKQNINNSKTKVIPEAGKKQRKNSRSQVCSNG